MNIIIYRQHKYMPKQNSGKLMRAQQARARLSIISDSAAIFLISQEKLVQVDIYQAIPPHAACFPKVSRSKPPEFYRQDSIANQQH